MQELWQKLHPSLFSITFLDSAGERITSGTGFKMGGYLITNNHVIQVAEAKRVILRSVGKDGFVTTSELEYSRLHFQALLAYGQPESEWDFAIIAINDGKFNDIPNLEVQESSEVDIGLEVCFLGFQFDHRNLSIHQGFVSSTFVKAGVDYIQIDGSVNHGNSGGPLVDISTGKVIGIVTRKATGLTKEFENLDLILKQNITTLRAIYSQRGGSVFLSGIDPVKVTLDTQVQLRILARNIGRSANVGIGYAYDISEIRSALNDL